MDRDMKIGAPADGAPELSIVVPALNEAPTIVQVITSYTELATRLVDDFEMLVIDDGSTDATFAVVAALAERDPRIRAWRHDVNQGYGPTLLELYRRSRGRWIFYAPADGQVPPRALELMWAARDGHACVVGRRATRAASPARKVISLVYRLVIRSLIGVSVADPNTSKLLDGERVRGLPLSSVSPFAEAEILARLKRSGASIVEATIPIEPRRVGRASGASLRAIAATLRDLIRFLIREGRA